MSAHNDGGPAFPVQEFNVDGTPATLMVGMSLRDYFAAKAMQGMLESEYDLHMRGHDGWRDEFAREAYRYATAMLAARGAA